MKNAKDIPKTKKFKSLEDLIAYDGSEMPDEKSRVLAKILTNNAAMVILIRRNEKLLDEYARLIQ